MGQRKEELLMETRLLTYRFFTQAVHKQYVSYVLILCLSKAIFCLDNLIIYELICNNYIFFHKCNKRILHMKTGNFNYIK